MHRTVLSGYSTVPASASASGTKNLGSPTAFKALASDESLWPILRTLPHIRDPFGLMPDQLARDPALVVPTRFYVVDHVDFPRLTHVHV